MAETLRLGGREFGSRLILGSGKYPSNEIMRDALETSGAEIVTVAVRRVDLTRSTSEALLNWIDPERYLVLPNTAGATTAAEAIRIAHLGRAAGFSEFVKLEVIGDERTLYPDTAELVEATRELVREGFQVMPYTSDDPVVARKLEDAGAICVMPLASPIGSGQGILNPQNLLFIREAVDVPVIVDAGVGTASDAVLTMELGVDGILMNTAIAQAADPVRMARAMRLAVEAGRLAWEAGRMPKRPYAMPSSPREGMLV
ncbi:MAG: thiazole synthase [Gemmatimonadetes bacterium]|nr:thiazole synthase [Gemmatimonadota bacterium]